MKPRTASTSRSARSSRNSIASCCEKSGIDAIPHSPRRWIATRGRALKESLAAVIKTKTRDEWDAIMLGSDVCYAPVLSLAEAPKHPHNVARETFVEIDGVTQPAPAPRFSRTPPASARSTAARQRRRTLCLGLSATDVEALHASGAI